LLCVVGGALNQFDTEIQEQGRQHLSDWMFYFNRHPWFKKKKKRWGRVQYFITPVREQNSHPRTWSPFRGIAQVFASSNTERSWIF
jgi:hypothetical protein